MYIPELVAHRGYAARYPENTLPALAAALQIGAPYVEFDVQLSRDGVPVVIHDAALARTAGCPGEVFDMTATELERVVVGEAERFGAQFCDVTIPTLDAAVELLRRWPHAHAFVEIKRESVRRHGTEAVVRSVLEVLRPVAARAVVISFDAEVLRRARADGATRVGWVFEGWQDAAREEAAALQPEFLFTDHREIPSEVERLWPGEWQWVLYDITEAELALSWAARGAALIETWAIGDMLGHPLLGQRRASDR